MNQIDVFYSYSHRDEELRNELEKHLSRLRRAGLIRAWHDRRIAPGIDWSSDIDAKINSAQVILLLISSDFMASDYCHEIEMKRAMELHLAGSAKVGQSY